MISTLLGDVSPLLDLGVLGGLAVAGLTIFAGLVFGGLWIARRLLGKPPASGGDREGEAPPLS
jgi:hypothetical protein